MREEELSLGNDRGSLVGLEKAEKLWWGLKKLDQSELIDFKF